MPALGCRLQREVFPAREAGVHPVHGTTYSFCAKGNSPPQPTAKQASCAPSAERLSTAWEAFFTVQPELWRWKLSVKELSCQQSISCPATSLPWLPAPPLTGLSSGLPASVPAWGISGGQAASWRQAHQTSTLRGPFDDL